MDKSEEVEIVSVTPVEGTQMSNGWSTYEIKYHYASKIRFAKCVSPDEIGAMRKFYEWWKHEPR